MSDRLTINMMTRELYNYWRLLIGEVISSDIEFFQSDQGNQMIEGMKKIHNKLALCTLTEERSILSFTGLQGVGKTTIIKSLYDLDDTYLPENLGRGEQIPVLVTESDVTEPYGLVCRSKFDEKNGINIVEERLEPAEFCRIAKNPQSKDIWLELKVPFRYSYDEKKSFALLPGFEKDADGKSQQLLNHLLRLSISSVVVFRKDTYARDTSEKMFKEVRRIYREVKPIFVLSYGDINPEQNDQMRKQMMDDFMIDADESDRIVISGDPMSFKEPWKEQLMDAIQNYAYISSESEKKQIDMLENLFMDVRKHVDAIGGILKKREEKLILESRGIYSNNKTFRIINDFERCYEKLISDIENEIRCELQNRGAEAKKNFNEYVQENNGFFKKMTSKFKVNALREQEELEDAIRDAWENAIEKNPEEVMADILGGHIEGGVSLIKGLEAEPVIEKDHKAYWVEDVEIMDLDELEFEEFDFDEGGLELQNIDEIGLSPSNTVEKMNSVQRIDKFFAPKERNKPVSLEHQDMKTMALMGAVLFRQAFVAKPILEEMDKINGLQLFEMKQMDMSPMSQSIKNAQEFANNVQSLGTASSILMKSIPVVLGVDGLKDGKIDIIQNASNALVEIGIPISPLELLGVLGVGFGITWTVNAIEKAVGDTNQYQLKLAQAGHRAIDKMPELQSKAFSNSLRRIFEKMSEQLADVHRERIGTYQNYGQLERMQYSLSRIKNLNRKLQKMVYDNAGLTL